VQGAHLFTALEDEHGVQERMYGVELVGDLELSRQKSSSCTGECAHLSNEMYPKRTCIAQSKAHNKECLNTIQAHTGFIKKEC
jgi:hypothetical protein